MATSTAASAREKVPPTMYQDIKAIWLDIRIDSKNTTRIEGTDLERLQRVLSQESRDHLLEILKLEDFDNGRPRVDIVQARSAPPDGSILEIIFFFELSDVVLGDRRPYSVLTYDVRMHRSLRDSRLVELHISMPASILVDVLPALKETMEAFVESTVDEIARELRQADR
jgi:hypothetical protein